jgi:hypothetical protein
MQLLFGIEVTTIRQKDEGEIGSVADKWSRRFAVVPIGNHNPHLAPAGSSCPRTW